MSDAEFYDYFKSLIPKGIYYEAQKNRWRVRLYKGGNVVYLRYFKTYECAFDAYDGAKQTQRKSKLVQIEKLKLKTNSTRNLIISLSQL